ncbi:MAG: hypothetical protein HYZ61_01800 [Candidatus Andersenbacteria bacterium]|nr:hypothetical protein [Candidatus Andersenbacteria bacterium]
MNEFTQGFEAFLKTRRPSSPNPSYALAGEKHRYHNPKEKQRSDEEPTD